MAITRTQLETLLVGSDKISGRAGRMAVKARLYVAADVTLGTIPALADPIYQGLRSIGIYAADPTAPVDGDMVTLPPSGLSQVLDVAELRLLESCMGNWDRWDETAGVDSQAQGKLGELLQKRIEAVRKQLKDIYGNIPGVTAASTFGVGVIGLDFQQTTDPLEDWPIPNA